MIRSRKARHLEKAGLRYVAGWVKAEDATQITAMIEEQKPTVEQVIQNVSS
jgi:hypothetical protein